MFQFFSIKDPTGNKTSLRQATAGDTSYSAFTQNSL